MVRADAITPVTRTWNADPSRIVRAARSGLSAPPQAEIIRDRQLSVFPRKGGATAWPPEQAFIWIRNFLLGEFFPEHGYLRSNPCYWLRLSPAQRMLGDPRFTQRSVPGAAMTPRVLIVDDEVDGCWLTAFVLRRDPGLVLAGEATDGDMALSLVRQERPDVVVIDIMMRRLNGLEATTQIKREWPDTKVVVLTHLTDDDTRRAAFESGADAFLDKRDMASALVPAIWDACEPDRPRPRSAGSR